MKKSHLLFAVLILLIACGKNTYEKVNDGIIIKLKKYEQNSAKILKIQVVSDDIIRVIASPEKDIKVKNSLMVIHQNSNDIKWETEEIDGYILVKTSKIIAKVNTQSGEIEFFDKEGNPILAEKKGGGKYFSPVNIEGKSCYSLKQQFESPEDEAFYGLGQHQHDQFNYKGQDVDLTQHNIVSVVPFLVSNKKYGILWDNYSITKFGDSRDYEELSSLTLFNKEGLSGGLTATYSSISEKNKIYKTKTENRISYEYLDSLKNLPEEFKIADGKVTWDGYMESKYTGMHKFLLYSSGYVKCWINNELVLDNWRQQWNPWSRKIVVPMEKDGKYEIKIEWIPDGGEAYIAFKWLSPLDPVEQNRLSLSSEVGDMINYYFISYIII